MTMLTIDDNVELSKIKLPREPHSLGIFLIKVRRSYRDFSSQADPCMKNSYEIQS